MFEITQDNALEFLRSKGWIDGPARIETLGGGVSNVVLRVTTPAGAFVLKQSRPQLRTKDAWFSDLDRVYREQEVMQFLKPLLPAGAVPEVLFADRANYVFAMSHAPAAAPVWKEMLLSGDFDASQGDLAGRLLGRMHEATARCPERMADFADHRVFVQLRVDPFYRRVQERRPEVAGPVGDLIERMLSLHEAICHGDYTPKNLLLHAAGFTLVDYECAHYGDPTMDLGLFLAHLLLKAARARGDTYLDLTRAAWRGYASEVSFRPIHELTSRAIGHLGACLLARIDGTSPVDYLPEEPRREAVRRLGRRLLLEPPERWDDVLETAEREFA